MHSTLESDVRVDSITEALRTLTDTTPTVPTPRAHLLDRIALRVGLALLLWAARRTRTPLTHEAHVQLRQQERDREIRERATLRHTLLDSLSR